MCPSTYPSKLMLSSFLLIPPSRYRGFIQIAVGSVDQLQTFDVHEHLVTSRSLFFKHAMSGAWKESHDRLIKLPEDDPMTFQIYVHLLYTNTLAVVLDLPPDKDNGTEEHKALAKLYVLAEKLQDVDTKNAVVEAMVLASRQLRKENSYYTPGCDTVQIVYAGTMPGSPMRRLLVDFYTYRADKGWLSVENETWPCEFLHEFAVRLLEGRECPEDVTTTGDASRYMEGRDTASI
jgi:hypothetical protein